MNRWEKLPLIVVFISILWMDHINAQSFTYDHSTLVVQGDAELTLPFAGGLNTPQFYAGDLNNDGLKDLVIFERTGDKVITLINESSEGESEYFFWPDYALPFPAMTNWMIFLDYNCDGLEDIITSNGLGVKTFLASNDGFSISYIPDQSPLEFSEAGFDFALGVGYIDIPGFADVDFDGDIDVLTFNAVTAGTVDYFQNMQVEEGLDCGTWKLEHVHSCWGNFFESGLKYSVDLNYECKGVVSSTADPMHAGSTFMIFDEDADHDMDLVLGDLAFGNLNFLENGGDSEAALITSQDTTFPSYDFPYNLQIFPAAFLIDLNNDGKKDMVASPNNENFSENFKNVWYYENVSTDETFVFDFVSDSFLVSDMIDVGERSFPAFFDHNQDGLMDLVIGNKGYFNNGDYDAMIALYENIGTPEIPKYKLITRDLGGISIYDEFNSICPAFADLDNDGDEDMLLGEEDGEIHFFRNVADAGEPAEFILAAANFQGIDPGKNSTPQLIDVNDDGLTDLILGEQNGNLNFYLNTGNADSPVFTLQNENWGGVDVRTVGSLTGYSVPELVRTGDEYVLYVGCENGTIYKYIPTPDFSGTFTLESPTFNQVDEGTFSSVRFNDNTGDGLPEMITGNERGGVTLYKNDNAVAIEDENHRHEIFIYPNPATDFIKVQIPDYNNALQMNISTIDGKRVTTLNIDGNQMIVEINNLPAGIYFVEIRHPSGSAVTKFIKCNR